MRVFVESNFVLELALQQEEHRDCERILDLARKGEVRLTLPAFALFEPYTTLDRRRKERLALSEKIKVMVQELSRSEPLAEAARQTALHALLVQSTDLAAKAFDTARDSLLEHAQVLALDARTFRDAHDWTDQLSLPDALVLMSVWRALEDEPPGVRESCFITRNSRDFDDPLIKMILEKRGCTLLHSFGAGLGFINSRLQPRG